MKEIRAILQPHVLDRVLTALHALPHFPGVTVSDCQGQGRARGEGGAFRADEDTIFLSKKCRLELVCADNLCDSLVDTIEQAAHTGNPGDGMITVADLPRVIRIRTREEQEKAV